MIWFPGSGVFTSPLLKIPLVLSCTAITTLAQTPPNPPASREELEKYGGKTDTLSSKGNVQVAARIYRAAYWLNAIGETAIILAEHSPSPIAHDVLSLFVHKASYARGAVRITPLWLTGCALMCGGAAIRLWCHRMLGKFFTWELTVKKGHVLVTRGPYAVVRHPSYVGSLMICVGAIMCYCSPGGWYRECIGWDTLLSKVVASAWVARTLSIPAMLMLRMNKEDEVMRREFGVKWDAYARRTPYRLLPFIY